MQGAYSTYFDNLFLALRMARPDYKAQAQYNLLAGREANLGAVFTPLLAELEAAISDFNENLADRNQSTSGLTDAFQLARKNWLTFVDDTMKDYVTPKLRKQPVYADFKKFGKSKLAVLNQDTLITQAGTLLNLYIAQQDDLYSELGEDAQKLYDALVKADKTRDSQEATITGAILDLADDRAAIARAQRRLKAQLELTFDNPAKVYSFFDFSKARLPKAKKKANGTSPTA